MTNNLNIFKKKIENSIFKKNKLFTDSVSGLIILTLVTFSLLGVSACSSVERVRSTSDVLVANKKHFTLEALVQAEIECQRVRKLRCHSSFLNPSSISGAALHPSLGQSWVDELLRDCPEYAAFISELVLRRAKAAGVEPLSGSSRPSHRNPVRRTLWRPTTVSQACLKRSTSSAPSSPQTNCST